MKRRPALLGFTLLEVMIAVVILAVGLSSLFTSEAGAIRIAQRARTTTIATLLARCKMAEIEEKVLKGTGWPTSNLEERDECCEGGEHEGFRCEWKVERIKLPDADESADGGVGKDGESKDGKSGSESGSKSGGENAAKSAGKPNILDQMNEMGKDNDERMGAITGLLSGEATKGGELGGGSSSGGAKKNRDGGADDYDDQGGAALDPIGSMVMGMAFPVMKPVIEEGVRRATVKVMWKEGDKEQEFEVNQFLVSENQIIAAEGEDADGGTTPTTPGTTPTTTTNTNQNTSSTSSTTGGN